MKLLMQAVALTALLLAPVFAEDAATDLDFEPVHPEKLIKLLPGGTSDFTAAKPKGALSGEFGSKSTVVSRVYTYKGDDVDEDEEERPTLTIKMTDSAASKSFNALYETLVGMGQSTTSGFSNAISIDGYPAIRNYREKDQVGLLSLYVADRFFVQIAIRGLPEDTMIKWWNKIDAKKLEALAVPPTPTPVPTPSHTPVAEPSPTSES